MQPLPPQVLPAVPHISFWNFNMAVPNILVMATLILAFGIAAWARLPRVLEPEPEQQVES